MTDPTPRLYADPPEDPARVPRPLQRRVDGADVRNRLDDLTVDRLTHARRCPIPRARDTPGS